MVNLKYPGGLKVKAPLGWLGAIAIGFGPLFFFWETRMSSESMQGMSPKNTTHEEQYWINWMNSDFKQCIQCREILSHNPNYQFSTLDKRRLKLKDLGNADNYLNH